MRRKPRGRVKRAGSARPAHYGPSYKRKLFEKAAAATNAPAVVIGSDSDAMRPLVTGTFQPRQARRVEEPEPIVDAREPRWSLIKADKNGALDLRHPFMEPTVASKVLALQGSEDDWSVTARTVGCAWHEVRFFNQVVSLPASRTHHLMLTRGVASITAESGIRHERLVLLRVSDKLDSAEQDAWLERELRAGGGQRFCYVLAVTAAPPGRDGPITWKPGVPPAPLGAGVPITKRFEVSMDEFGKIVSSRELTQ